MVFSFTVDIMHNGKVQEREQGQVATEQSPTPEVGPKPARNRRILWVMLLLLVGSAGVSFALFRYVLPRIPRELVGTWQVVDGNMKGATLEFGWLGTGSATMYKHGKKEVAQSSVRVRGNRIFMTYKDAVTGLDDTVIQTIVKLSDDELVFRDQDEVTYRLTRID